MIRFSNWLSESLAFPRNWQDLPAWQLLRLMGFKILKAEGVRQGTVAIDSPYSNVVLHLTPRGQVRTSRGGLVFSTEDSNPMPRLLEYVIQRFAKKGIPQIPEEDLDALIEAHPQLLDFLLWLPKIRKGVLQRTGMADPRGDSFSRHGLSIAVIKWLNKCSNKAWSIDESTGRIDVGGNFYSVDKNPLGFRGVNFGKISGSFVIQNAGLTSLQGAPQTVAGNFDCSSNNLTTLQGAPRQVGWSFGCSRNPDLRSLWGAPEEVGGNFNCQGTGITSLDGCPRKFKSINLQNTPIASFSRYAKDFIELGVSVGKLPDAFKIVNGLTRRPTP